MTVSGGFKIHGRNDRLFAANHPLGLAGTGHPATVTGDRSVAFLI